MPAAVAAGAVSAGAATPPTMSSTAGVPYIGSRISLVSKSSIRYEGTLYSIDTQVCGQDWRHGGRAHVIVSMRWEGRVRRVCG